MQQVVFSNFVVMLCVYVILTKITRNPIFKRLDMLERKYVDSLKEKKKDIC
jgi:hypothetical protein